ncbi:MAG: AraC family ligand binding domain-containing protein [Caldilineaceae bacterium]
MRHAYPRHSHDYYVLCVIEEGVQSFTHQGSKHITPPGGVILINPGAVHTGEAADAQGFRMCSIYPTTAHMQRALCELTGRHQGLPFFADVQVNQPETATDLLALHSALREAASTLECEERFLWTLAALIKRYADKAYSENRLGIRPKQYAKPDNLSTNISVKVSLQQLCDQVAFNLLPASFPCRSRMPPMPIWKASAFTPGQP